MSLIYVMLMTLCCHFFRHERAEKEQDAPGSTQVTLQQTTIAGNIETILWKIWYSTQIALPVGSGILLSGLSFFFSAPADAVRASFTGTHRPKHRAELLTNLTQPGVCQALTGYPAAEPGTSNRTESGTSSGALGPSRNSTVVKRSSVSPMFSTECNMYSPAP